MTTALTEDDIYRSSTQYRLWSFAPEQLDAQRRTTHEIALQRARQYAAEDEKINEQDYLTVEEELRLVQRYCGLIGTTSEHLKWPPHVKATAIQYLKRFYLSNSCTTYPPKEIYKTVLFLASKTEAIHVTVSNFANNISADSEAILAPEYKVMQALRFTLDVRHPSRGSKGILMELQTLASSQSNEELHTRMISLAPPSASSRTPWRATLSQPLTTALLLDRIQLAYTTIRDLLSSAASLTDVYFLYTPSQILLASLRIADLALYDFYLDLKLASLASETAARVRATISNCAEIMAAFDSKRDLMSKEEARALEARLERCRDPATKDLIEVSRAMKRGAEGGKKDKSDKKEDDIFGPKIG